ncbi:hypothetical protein [Paraburkholderia humisilvae]|uniref:Uncharacterized protein n=1 Tax=Paraburkholderia humisilvae TaxID=627669 RepID=A0A6J5DMD7_9BURK|nr:hypothetical protein [Paraburkholderia humisilvae]CAB3754371.1 hypothetical protein LMG29542_02331 [Paraburkholderia humisilvae]
MSTENGHFNGENPQQDKNIPAQDESASGQETIPAPAARGKVSGISGQLACAAGAFIAVGVGMYLFSATGLTPILTFLHAVWHGLVWSIGAFFPALAADIPWLPTLCIVGGLAAYSGCRYARSGVHERAFVGLLAVLLGLGVIYLIGAPAGIDLEVLFRNVAIMAFVFSVALSKGLKIRRPPKSEKSCGCVSLVGAVSVLTCAAAIILQVFHWFDAADSMPDVSREVQAQYGAELARMGFEDVNRSGQQDGGICKSLHVVFRDGTATDVAPVDVWPTDRADPEYSDADYSHCLALRLRGGKLTMIVPDPGHNATRDETRAAVLNAADATMGVIRAQYAEVEHDKAVADSWKQK